MKSVAFEQEQVKYLNKLMEDRTNEVMKSLNKEGNMDKTEIRRVCEKMSNLNSLKVEKSSKRNSKNKKSKKSKKKKTGYMKWLWSADGMSVLKKENNNVEQKELFKLAGKKWANMSNSEKKKYD